jgi:hypothetical protein
MDDETPRITGNNAIITEYSATSSPRVVKVRKFAVYGPHCFVNENLDTHDAQQLHIWYVKPQKRKWHDQAITLLHGTATILYRCEDPHVCYNNNHYVLIEHDGKVLFDSREVFPCDMQEFARDRESYLARMAERGFSRESLNLDTPTFLP